MFYNLFSVYCTGVLDLIPPVVEDEVQLCVVVGVDRDHVLHQVEDLLVQEVADDMVSMIDHLHTDRPEGKILLCFCLQLELINNCL